MTTKELIEILSKQDPNSQVHNGAIPTHIACIERILSDDKIQGLLPSAYLEQIEQVIKENKSQRPVWNTLYRSTWNPHDALKDMI